jgi:hypothetical protein
MNTGAHPLKAGFNQSGGAYFMTLANLENVAGTAVYVNRLTSAGSNSGGAFVGPTLERATMLQILGAPYIDSTAAPIVNANTVLKDMGKTVVSSGRVFRKFAPVVRTASNGVVGQGAVAPNAGYGSFYLEVGMGSAAAGATPAPIARYA